MGVPIFGFLAGIEVTEKFVVVGGVEHMATVSNLNASCFRVALSWVSWVTLGFDNISETHYGDRPEALKEKWIC